MLPVNSSPSGSSSGTSHTCDGIVAFISDGDCDALNNNEDCDYDGGDCCPCTCSDTLNFMCGDSGFDCKDPEVSTACTDVSTYFEAPDSYELYPTPQDYVQCLESGGIPSRMGDGYCDRQNNKWACRYDLGDCCSCTCRDTSAHVCGKYVYDCRDPTVPEACVVESEYHRCPRADGIVSHIGDLWCDDVNNIEECGFDGGDCCPCTCGASTFSATSMSFSFFFYETNEDCGIAGYHCVDPSVPEACASESYPFVPPYDAPFNDDDGAPSNDDDGAPFNDDDAPFYDDGIGENATCSQVGGRDLWIGDTWCDPENNVKECDYDGGDCCACTCGNFTLPFNSSNSPESSYVRNNCGDVTLDCVDPAVPEACVNESKYFVRTCFQAGGVDVWVGDKRCDLQNNIHECDYDGGDCCTCTCGNSMSSFNSSLSSYYRFDYEFQCGDDFYDCVDDRVSDACMEESNSFVPDGAYDDFYYRQEKYVNCTEAGGIARLVGNGLCDIENNIEICDYDGGDCCLCTCSDCSSFRAFCVDPSSPCPKNSSFVSYSGVYIDCDASGGDVAFIGDGDCDSFNNQDVCGYDGGDCCRSTCADMEEYVCGSHGGYDCKDPEGN